MTEFSALENMAALITAIGWCAMLTIRGPRRGALVAASLGAVSAVFAVGQVQLPDAYLSAGTGRIFIVIWPMSFCLFFSGYVTGSMGRACARMFAPAGT